MTLCSYKPLNLKISGFFDYFWSKLVNTWKFSNANNSKVVALDKTHNFVLRVDPLQPPSRICDQFGPKNMTQSEILGCHAIFAFCRTVKCEKRFITRLNIHALFFFYTIKQCWKIGKKPLLYNNFIGKWRAVFFSKKEIMQSDSTYLIHQILEQFLFRIY